MEYMLRQYVEFDFSNAREAKQLSFCTTLPPEHGGARVVLFAGAGAGMTAGSGVTTGPGGEDVHPKIRSMETANIARM